jgi:hypothetical protein
VPEATLIGRVTVIAWPSQSALAAALGDIADRAAAFPGVGPMAPNPIRLVLAPSRAAFDSITRGRMPSWSDGAAFPESGTVVLLADGTVDRLAVVLRHELGHLALRWSLGRRAPLWFEEGYAAVAAREWGRLDALRLNWRVARGDLPDFDNLDRALRGPRAEAQAAYALATSAVLLLERWGGEQGFVQLLEHLRREGGFEAAIREAYHVTGDDFEARWHRDLRSRYGWLSWATGVGLFWAVAGVLLAALWGMRRRRYRERRAGLDEGWVIPVEEANP